MRMLITTTDRPFSLRLPTRMVLNALSVYGYCKAQSHPIPLRQARNLCKRLRKYVREYPHIPLLEVRTQDAYILFRL